MDKKHKLFGNFEKILKIFDKNSIEKLNFSRLLEKCFLKIDPSEITSFFYNNSFNFWRGNVPRVPLWQPLCFTIHYLLYLYENIASAFFTQFYKYAYTFVFGFAITLYLYKRVVQPDPAGIDTCWFFQKS